LDASVGQPQNVKATRNRYKHTHTQTHRHTNAHTQRDKYASI